MYSREMLPQGPAAGLCTALARMAETRGTYRNRGDQERMIQRLWARVQAERRPSFKGRSGFLYTNCIPSVIDCYRVPFSLLRNGAGRFEGGCGSFIVGPQGTIMHGRRL